MSDKTEEMVSMMERKEYDNIIGRESERGDRDGSESEDESKIRTFSCLSSSRDSFKRK